MFKKRNPKTPILIIFLVLGSVSAFAEYDPILITPEDIQYGSGYVGEPLTFTPSSFTYYLENLRTNQEHVSVTSDVSWVTVPATVSIDGGGGISSADININTGVGGVGDLAPGYHDATISFISDYSTKTRVIRILVKVQICDAVEKCDFVWTTGGNAEWYGQVDVSHDAVDAAQSGLIDNDEETWTETISYNPGILSFWWKVSSEADYALLEFYINGVRKDYISGNVDWQQMNYTLDGTDPDYISTGEFVLRWKYVKNHAYSIGADTGWLDNVTFVPEDDLLVTPGSETVYEVCGPIADHTSIACTDYTVTNADLANPFNWTVSWTETWLDVTPTSGSLAAGDSVTVTACLTADAEALSTGIYEDTLVFTNTDTAYEVDRKFTLRISEGIPTVPTLLSPLDGTAEVSPVSAILSWSGEDTGGCATDYTVYCGVDPDPLSTPDFVFGPGPEMSYELPMLQESMPYYWQVVAENCCGAAEASPIWTFTSGSLNALVYFVSCGGGQNYAEMALENLGFNPLTVTDAATFESELAKPERNWEVVIVDAQGGTLDATTLDGLHNYYSLEEGRIIFSHSNLDAYAVSGHQFLGDAGVDYVSSYIGSDPVYVWEAMPMFTWPNPLPTVLVTEELCPEFGYYVALRGGGSTAVAGYTFGEEAQKAAIVVNADSRIVFNAFRPQTVTSDNNDNPLPDMVELYENQIAIATTYGCDPDETPPEINLLGNTTVTLECGNVYESPGVYAWDYCDGVISNVVPDTSQLDPQLVGAYTVYYSVTDSSGNTSATLERTVNVVDTTAPLISLLGDATYTMECGYDFDDPGVFALDACDGNLTDSIVDDADLLDTGSVGVYTVTYSVTDGAGLTSQVVRTVNVEDTELPSITLIGDNPMTVECGSAYDEPGATAVDACSGDMTESIVVGGDTVNSDVVGSYTVTYTVTDPESNSVEEQRIVNVVDTTIPVITLNGEAAVTTECSFTYSDEGATALDVCDGDITTSIDTVNPVDTSVIGVYEVTYNVTDAQGNAAVEVIRSVEVVDTTQAAISLGTFDPTNYAGDGFLLHECSTPFMEPEGFIVEDACDGDLGNVDLALTPGDTGVTAWAWAISSEVYSQDSIYAYDAFTALRGDYLLVYVSADSSDNVYPALDVNGLPPLFDAEGNPTFIDGEGNANLTVDYARLVRIQDTTAPEIALLGDNPIVLECAAAYVSPGAQATDTCDGDISADVVIDASNLDTGDVGEYPVYYSVPDASGNTSEVLTRTVQVVDTTIPDITLIGDADITMECGDLYEEPGATAIDACDGDISNAIVIGGDVVDIAAVGTYILSYNVNDNEGNAAVEVTRIVRVQDTQIPIITLNGEAEVTVECGDLYSDAGATAADHCDGDLTNEIVIGGDTVDAGTVGVYIITYDVTDGEGHVATQVTRTITVQDTIEPVITRLGDEKVVIECADAYIDAGATAEDYCDGDITESIVTVNPVDTTVVGSYSVTYNVADGQGNTAVEVTRNVEVVNTTIPVITLPAVYVPVDCGKEFDAAFAAITDALTITASNPCGDLTADIRVTEIKVTYPKRGDAITYTVESINTTLIQEGKLAGFEGDYTGTLEQTIMLFQNYFLFKPAVYEVTYAVQEPQPIETTQIIRIDDQCQGPLGCYSCDSCTSQRPTPGIVKNLQRFLSDWLLVGSTILVLAVFRKIKY